MARILSKEIPADVGGRSCMRLTSIRLSHLDPGVVGLAVWHRHVLEEYPGNPRGASG